MRLLLDCLSALFVAAAVLCGAVIALGLGLAFVVWEMGDALRFRLTR